MRVSQIKEQLEAIGDIVEEDKIVMNTSNGLPRSWESFIKENCSKRKMKNFSRLWEDCTQEEARLVAREENLCNDNDQALETHTIKGKSIKQVHLLKKIQNFLEDSKGSKGLFKLKMLQLPEDGTHFKNLSSNKKD